MIQSSVKWPADVAVDKEDCFIGEVGSYVIPFLSMDGRRVLWQDSLPRDMDGAAKYAKCNVPIALHFDKT